MKKKIKVSSLIIFFGVTIMVGMAILFSQVHGIQKTQNELLRGVRLTNGGIVQLIDETQQNRQFEAEIELQKNDGSVVEIEGKDLGMFTITHYCTCAKCCGKSNGITASGAVATPGRTVAVDPNVIPLGSVIMIDGKYYVAEDTGGAVKGNRIDMCEVSHEEALNAGIQQSRVFLIGGIR